MRKNRRCFQEIIRNLLNVFAGIALLLSAMGLYGGISYSVTQRAGDRNSRSLGEAAVETNRPQWKSEATPTPEEGLSAIRGFGAYCATIEIHAKEGFMVRNYEINQPPNAVDRATKRWYTFHGTDRMSLRVDASELNRPVVESTFIWERVDK